MEHPQRSPANDEKEASSWTPLKQPVFRAIWIATLVSNIGTWMHDVGAAWLMTSLAPSPFMVSLVQAATTLPMFLFALPAGVLADIIDRRRLLIFAQGLMLVTAAGLSVLQLMGLVSPAVLLVATFGLGLGAALNAPPFQAIVPELVSKNDIPSAVALNSLGINIARAIGPAVGGVIVAASGPAAVFAVNAVSVVGVLTVLIRWRRQPRRGSLPPENFPGAIRAGMRFLRQAPDMHTVLIRAAAFFAFASAVWALLPLIARQQLGLGAGGYGLLLGFIGAGAVIGAISLARLRRSISVNGTMASATILFATVAFALAYLDTMPAICAMMFLAGVGWIVTLSTLNVAAQMALPNWVRARTLAIYLVVFNGSMAAGSALWGAVATRLDIPSALTLAAAGQLVALLLVYRRRLPNQLLNLTPSLHWPAPTTAADLDFQRGPVLITVEYFVSPQQSDAFVSAMDGMRRIRLRDGAMFWELFEDAAKPGRWLEVFEVETWLEHLRQHERTTQADRVLQEDILKFHTGNTPPLISHFLAKSRTDQYSAKTSSG